MHASYGTNRKLGPHVGSWSRPVGSARANQGTCPDDCFFAGWNEASPIPPKNRCYAESLQRRRPSVETAWADGLTATPEDVCKAFVDAPRKIKANRIHVGGDFGKPGGRGIDHIYVRAVLAGIKAARKAGSTMPGWFYTHLWKSLTRYVPRFRKLGIECFASVHSVEEAREATKLGYRLAVDPGECKSDQIPARVQFAEFNIITCPEERGKGDCSTCGFCFRDLGINRGVAFWRH